MTASHFVGVLGSVRGWKKALPPFESAMGTVGRMVSQSSAVSLWEGDTRIVFGVRLSFVSLSDSYW